MRWRRPYRGGPSTLDDVFPGWRRSPPTGGLRHALRSPYAVAMAAIRTSPLSLSWRCWPPSPRGAAAEVTLRRRRRGGRQAAACRNYRHADPRFTGGRVRLRLVANGPTLTVTRLDPRTDAVTATISTPDPASVVSAGAGAIWVTSYPGNSLTRIDPQPIASTGRSASPRGVPARSASPSFAASSGSRTTTVSQRHRSPRSTPPRCV